MATNLQKAQDLLFGKDGLGVSNFKLYPGSDRGASPEDVAGQIAVSVEKLAKGELEEAVLD